MRNFLKTKQEMRYTQKEEIYYVDELMRARMALHKEDAKLKDWWYLWRREYQSWGMSGKLQAATCSCENIAIYHLSIIKRKSIRKVYAYSYVIKLWSPLC